MTVTSSIPAAADDPALSELRTLLRAGLPVRASQCGPVLLALSGVRSRAQADDADSRARALDVLLRAQLDRLENSELAPAARLLFGAVPATSGANLTTRRGAAAAAAGYEVHHFRKRIEPKLVELVAWQLRRVGEDLADRLAPPELRAATGRPILPADVFAWEAAEHQRALATLWGAAYLLRAELLSIAQLVSMEAPGSALAQVCVVALWRQAALLRAARDYRSAYGTVLLHAAEPGPEPGRGQGPDQIAAAAGWTPPLTPAQELLLAELADPSHGLADFTARLDAADGGPALAATWQRALTGRDGGPAPHQEETT